MVAKDVGETYRPYPGAKPVPLIPETIAVNPDMELHEPIMVDPASGSLVKTGVTKFSGKIDFGTQPAVPADVMGRYPVPDLREPAKSAEQTKPFKTRLKGDWKAP